MKTIATIAGNRKFICLLLALLLAVGNIAYSSHVSRHNASDTGFCSLCIHPGSPNAAITGQADVLFAGAARLILNRAEPGFRCLRAAKYAHQSRAPPRIA